MSQLVVLAFDAETDARAALDSIRKLEHQGLIQLEDTAVIVHGQDGKMQVTNEVSGTTETGAVGGALIGGLLFFAFPLAGLAVGALAGAGIGAALDRGVDGKFVKDVQTQLAPGKSALFLVIRRANQAAALAAMRQFSGSVIQTTLDDETEAALREALRQG
jgi:uncharacterized membrane protein